jgi:hypothetical protein
MRLARAVTWVLIGLGAALSVWAFLAMARGGISWDAPVDARAVAEVRALPEGATLEEAYEGVTSTSEFYGLLVSQLADGAHEVITGSSDVLEPWNLATYRWQGGVTIMMAIAAAAALGTAVARALRSPLAGAFTWALTMATPVFFGMTHVNFKDVPVAAGLTLMTSGLILSRVGKASLTRWLSGAVVMSLGGIVTLGTRPGAWPLMLALTAGTLVVYALVDLRRRNLRATLPTAAGAGLAGVVTLLMLWLTNPFARIDVFRWLGDSFSVMRAYPWENITRAGGQDLLATDLPWWYLPGWLLAQLPVLTTVALLWAAIAVVASLARAQWSVPRGDLVSLTPLVIQGVVLPVLIVVTGSVIYDGLRHVLFMLPALAGLAAIGVAALERRSENLRGRGPAVAAIAALVVVGASAWATARWMPYSYAFINPIAGSDRSERDWELDYWGVTALEGVRLLKEAGLPVVTVEPTIGTSDLVGSLWPDDAKAQAPDGYGLYVFNRWDASIGACEPLFTIERDGQVLGEGARCTKWTR